MMSLSFALLLLMNAPADAAKAARVERYAVLKAHRILPATLRHLVKRHPDQLFAGLEEGLSVSAETLDENRILKEAQTITEMVNAHAPFSKIVHQMGYVSGLVARQTRPGRNSSDTVKAGIAFYCELKLEKFFFVFDGYQEPHVSMTWLGEELRGITRRTLEQSSLLQKQYDRVGGNSRFAFDERSPVFGVCSIYFSNLARLSAHLWYHAWASANGDLTQTPYLKKSLKNP